MKTLLLSEQFPPRTSGSSRWFWEIYRRLPADRVFIAAGEDPRQAPFDAYFPMPLQRVPLTLPSGNLTNLAGLKGYWRAVKTLNRLVKEEGIGRIHCGRCLPEGLMALALKRWRGIPYLCYAHGEELFYPSQSREQAWLMKWVVNGAQLIIANSRNTERMLRSHWPQVSERIRVLHPGVDTTRFVPAPRSAAVRARLGWGDRPVLLTVGRLVRRRGHDHMILALSKIRQAFPDILYAIVGAGEELPLAQGLTRKEKLEMNVQFLGELDDDALVRCYQQCDLFVLPNRQIGQDTEGFGMVLVEAQACGRPVVAGASGGTAETMSVGETGRIVSCDSPAPLADLIVKMLRDRELLERMGRKARPWVVKHFDWDALTRQAAELFGIQPPSTAPVPTAANPSPELVAT